MEVKYNYELIKDYLDGTLESKARKEVEILLKEDEVARAIARGILILNEEFKQDEEKIEDYLDSLQTEQINKIRSHHSTGRRFPFLKIAASLVLLIIASVSIYKYASPDPEGYLDAQLAEPYQAPSVTRSGAETYDDYLSGMDDYRDQKYHEAYSRLSTLDKSAAIFYSGLCKLYLEDYDTAIELLNKDQLKASLFNQQSKWYLSLAYIKTGQNEKAMKLLQEISKLGAFKSKEAEKMKKLLN